MLTFAWFNVDWLYLHGNIVFLKVLNKNLEFPSLLEWKYCIFFICWSTGSPQWRLLNKTEIYVTGLSSPRNNSFSGYFFSCFSIQVVTKSWWVIHTAIRYACWVLYNELFQRYTSICNKNINHHSLARFFRGWKKYYSNSVDPIMYQQSNILAPLILAHISGKVLGTLALFSV